MHEHSHSNALDVMNMIDFKQAIQTAIEKVGELVPSAQSPVLEEAVISEDDKVYEITLSYNVDGPPPASGAAQAALAGLAGLLAHRREFRVFMIDKQSGDFRGFRRCKEGK
ncbi:hypothetical protein [Pseudomonas sp. KNUC1026]|uniref:hypothetical protein n=1 Tax=Pseudomonas sp. KNUC1026 TaxID=2893890 RepID=UPI001F39DA7F|nr:hypothetical protein [Pseudomonas sp. KNUC1026]UFH48403.1 hypothetical protein LN139_14805 [Pseudomonas sp. KNUC1026]